MKKFALWLSAVLILATASGVSRAGYSLFLSAENAEVNNLHVGDSVTFDVALSGVDFQDQSTYLSYVAATITFNETLLGAPLTITPGAIIPEASGFMGPPGLSGEADGLYDGIFIASTPISKSGTFFSFEVTALNPGQGTLSFDTTTTYYTKADDVQNNQFPLETHDLDFTIYANNPGTAVPEPSTLVLLISSMFGLSAGAGLRGLVRQVRLKK